MGLRQFGDDFGGWMKSAIANDIAMNIGNIKHRGKAQINAMLQQLGIETDSFAGATGDFPGLLS